MTSKKTPNLVEQVIEKVRGLIAPLYEEIAGVNRKVSTLGVEVAELRTDVTGVKERVQKIPVPAPAVKLCKDCRFCAPFNNGMGVANTPLPERWNLAKCARPDPSSVEWVLGGCTTSFCCNERNNEKKCGINGKYWEAA